MLSEETNKILKWTLPPIIVAILGVIGIELLADKLREMATSLKEIELIDIYATQFQFIAGIGLGLFTLGIEYMVFRFLKRY